MQLSSVFWRSDLESKLLVQTNGEYLGKVIGRKNKIKFSRRIFKPAPAFYQTGNKNFFSLQTNPVSYEVSHKILLQKSIFEAFAIIMHNSLTQHNRLWIFKKELHTSDWCYKKMMFESQNALSIYDRDMDLLPNNEYKQLQFL